MIGEVIVFPEVEAVAIGYLVDELTAREDTALVSDELPSTYLPYRVV